MKDIIVYHLEMNGRPTEEVPTWRQTRPAHLEDLGEHVDNSQSWDIIYCNFQWAYKVEHS